MKLFWLLLFSSLAFASSQQEAIDKAKDAAYIQVGAKSFVDKLSSYGEEQGKNTLNYLGIRYPASVLVGGYKIYRDKKISFPYHGDKITITPNSLGVELPF